MRFSLILILTLIIISVQGPASAQSILPVSAHGKAYRVILDPGHGGRDSATKSDGYYEKDIVLSIAKVIRQHLVRQGFDVVMTRETDEYISLTDRAAIKGDIFISLHANTVADTIGPSVRSMIKGMEIYTDKSMANGHQLPSSSKRLAAEFRKHLATVEGITLRGVREKSLAVLSLNQSPAILIELGFISNKDDLAFLTDPANYNKLAYAFSKAIEAFRLQPAR